MPRRVIKAIGFCGLAFILVAGCSTSQKSDQSYTRTPDEMSVGERILVAPEHVTIDEELVYYVEQFGPHPEVFLMEVMNMMDRRGMMPEEYRKVNGRRQINPSRRQTP